MNQKHHVLVVDDDKEIAGVIEIYLKQAGLAVTVAYNGMEALNALQNEELHLIIMDCMMPKFDGINTLLKIREEKKVPLILLLSSSKNTDKIFGLNISVDDYIIKPFNLLELIARVKSKLRRYTTFDAAMPNSYMTTMNTTGSDRAPSLFISDASAKSWETIVKNLNT